MPHAHDLIERSRMFGTCRPGDRSSFPREMAAHYQLLAVEHQEINDQLESELAH